MKKLYEPRFLLLFFCALVVLYCAFAAQPVTEACTISRACTNKVPAKATELLWESFSQQFVSAVAGY